MTDPDALCYCDRDPPGTPQRVAWSAVVRDAVGVCVVQVVADNYRNARARVEQLPGVLEIVGGPTPPGWHY